MIAEEDRHEWERFIASLRENGGRIFIQGGWRSEAFLGVAEHLTSLEEENAALRAGLSRAQEDRDGYERARDFWLNQWRDVLKQIWEWCDEGVSRADLIAYYKDTALPIAHSEDAE